MANKTQVATVGEQQAAVVINNQFIDGLTKQLEGKCKYVFLFQKTTISAMHLWERIWCSKKQKTGITNQFWNLVARLASQTVL